MSQGYACKDPTHRPHLHVVQRNQRCSAFDGYQVRASDYSAVRCPVCGLVWRTKGKFVDALPNAPADWMNQPLGFPVAVLPKRGVKVTSDLVRKIDEATE